jgi:pre-mRNA-splicing factor CWC26
MPVSKADYLASKYLTASTPSSSTKKRKRKNAANEGLIIADDDDLGWSKSTEGRDEDDGRPITVTSGSAEFRKAKKNAWKTVGIPALQPRDSEADEADKIIAQTAQENADRNDDEGPVVENEEGVVKMGDGTHAGLQSASAVAAQFAKRKREEKESWEKEERERKKKGEKGEETVYRDATGRRIDISLRRAEARRELEAAAKKELEEKEAQKGDIQRLEKEKRKEELYEAKFMPLARKVDDEDMNAEMREQERWNDPAAQFLVKKGKGKSKSGKELYQGAWAPNRYGIAPGYRWDGVDRGNGWEGERFKAVNRKTRNKELDFAWQMDT